MKSAMYPMIAIATLLALGDASAKPGGKPRPNVLLVMTDDQGYGDLGCHGNPIAKTPSLDRLHAQSVRLTNFHVDPACSPTRAALMTGRYSHRIGVWHVVMNHSTLRHDETTMAQVFAESGYRTALFGKWHLGDNYPYRPQDRGFAEVVTFGGGAIGHTPDFWLNDYFDDTYLHNGKWEKYTGYCTDVWFEQARRFIAAERERPFFVYLAANVPHRPLLAPRQELATYAALPEKARAFYAMVSNFDANLGRLRAFLKEHGLEENTILIFLTDNGTSGGTFPAGMRGAKASPYEGGHRVPCFIYWPAGQVRGGRDVGRLTAHIDLLPTLIELCGLTTPSGAAYDGRSLAPLLHDTQAAWPPRTLVVEWQGNVQPVFGNRCAVMDDRWRLVNGEELYDLPTDPSQEANVAAEHPEVVRALRAAYQRWWASVSTRDAEPKEVFVGADADNPVRLTAYSWINETGQQADMPWGQYHIVAGPLQNGYWPLRIRRAGEYEIRLRRWPTETALGINAVSDAQPPEKAWHPLVGCQLTTSAARIAIQSLEQSCPVAADAKEVVFRVRLREGSTRLQTWFSDRQQRSRGAYYVSIERLEPSGTNGSTKP